MTYPFEQPSGVGPFRVNGIDRKIVPINSINKRNSQGCSVLVDRGQEGRKPVVSHFTVSIEKHNNISRGGECSVVPGSYQPLPLSIPHQLHFGVVRLLDLILQFVVQVFQLRLVIHEDDLM